MYFMAVRLEIISQEAHLPNAAGNARQHADRDLDAVHMLVPE